MLPRGLRRHTTHDHWKRQDPRDAEVTEGIRLLAETEGIFAETADSGSAILDTSGGVVSSALESSNTDISEEFTKLIVTQQAYSANTKVITTANQMAQDLLNVLR